MLRPSIRLPGWLAIGIIVSALVIGKLLRGAPLSVNGADLTVLGIAITGILIAMYLRASIRRQTDGVDDEGGDKDESAR